jgi:hypothetical protein
MDSGGDCKVLGISIESGRSKEKREGEEIENQKEKDRGRR